MIINGVKKRADERQAIDQKTGNFRDLPGV
jgi:hypothetical protein